MRRTPGIEARHVKGTGAERLMFSFSRNGEPLKVYGLKFPVFDSGLLKKKRWRAVADTATPIVYLPFTEDTMDPSFVTGGRDYLLATARRAVEELRAAKAPGPRPRRTGSNYGPRPQSARDNGWRQTGSADLRRSGPPLDPPTAPPECRPAASRSPGP